MRSNRNQVRRLTRVARVGITLVSLFGASACIGPAVRESGSFDHSVAPRPLRRNTVDLQEIASSSESLYETLGKIRPEWFRVNPTMRQAAEPGRAAAFVDNVYWGELTTLALVPAADVIEVRYLSPLEARTEFGSACRCAGGIVRVFTRESAASRARIPS
jgi:hypothetical protein